MQLDKDFLSGCRKYSPFPLAHGFQAKNSKIEDEEESGVKNFTIRQSEKYDLFEYSTANKRSWNWWLESTCNLGVRNRPTASVHMVIILAISMSNKLRTIYRILGSEFRVFNPRILSASRWKQKGGANGVEVIAWTYKVQLDETAWLGLRSKEIKNSTLFGMFLDVSRSLCID